MLLKIINIGLAKVFWQMKERGMMTNRSGLVVLSAGIIAIGLGLYLLFQTGTAYPATVTVASREEARDGVELVYPQIQGLPKTGIQDKFNQMIQEEVESFAAKLSTPDYSGKVSYKVEYNDHYLLSVTLTELFYVKHAAHPMTYLRAFTMNTKTGEVYKLNDIFKPDSGYAEKINLLIEQQIAAYQIPMLKPFKGIGGNQEFYLSADGLVVYYQLYEYTPYFYGFLKFTIPYGQISDILNDNGRDLIAK